MTIKINDNKYDVLYTGELSAKKLVLWAQSQNLHDDAVIARSGVGITARSCRMSGKLPSGTARSFITAVIHAEKGTSQIARTGTPSARKSGGRKSARTTVKFEIRPEFVVIQIEDFTPATYSHKTGMVDVPASLMASYAGPINAIARGQFTGMVEHVDGAPIETGFRVVVDGETFTGADENEIRAKIGARGMELGLARDKRALKFSEALFADIKLRPCGKSRVADYIKAIAVTE